ncbi:hypothetical protein C8034_v012333 [Colletotrichum sidae]|uniref:Uncharacterized protein n=1 Tax=Colletotrichum sidae TaxID=1347389 RepID=A0A4R8TFW0_9PEZI|nr:hypothetical protein C8034_v012333 [Colletotrichum sidae]
MQVGGAAFRRRIPIGRTARLTIFFFAFASTRVCTPYCKYILAIIVTKITASKQLFQLVVPGSIKALPMPLLVNLHSVPCQLSLLLISLCKPTFRASRDVTLEFSVEILREAQHAQLTLVVVT